MSTKWFCEVHERHYPYAGECPMCAREKDLEDRERLTILIEDIGKTQLDPDVLADKLNNPGDYRCPNCKFKTLKSQAGICFKCQTPIDNDFWEAISRRKREAEEKAAAEREEQYRKLQQAAAEATAREQRKEAEARESARLQHEEHSRQAGCAFVFVLVPAIAGLFVLWALGAFTSSPQSAPDSLPSSKKHIAAEDDAPTAFTGAGSGGTGSAGDNQVQSSDTSEPVLPNHQRPDLIREWRDGIAQRWVPEGEFQMGCSPGDNECDEDEKPARAVRILKGFWMQESEVTQAAYERIVGNNPSDIRGEQLPVAPVGWNEAKQYCEQVGLRLPTEAEWEYASRGGTTGPRFGALDEVAWYGNNSDGRIHEVKGKKPNAYGLFDMLGNVWELTSSTYGDNGRVVRGGNWYLGARFVRASYRMRLELTRSNGGFRCVGD